MERVWARTAAEAVQFTQPLSLRYLAEPSARKAHATAVVLEKLTKNCSGLLTSKRGRQLRRGGGRSLTITAAVDESREKLCAGTEKYLATRVA